MKLNHKLQILPFGEVGSEVLTILSNRLGQDYDGIDILQPIGLPDSAFNLKRGQYLSDEFLKKVRTVPGKRVLGVTEVDIYTFDLNFVFGQAELSGKAAVISLNRLHHEDKDIFYSRMLKEAAHELGHTLGLRHCQDVKCVMYFSNSLMDTDIKGENYCARCEELLQKLIQ